MSMYLVSDTELNTIIRLRRQDVLKFLTEVQEQNPQATFDELVHATSHFFAAQAVQFDYLADYAQEELAYGLIEPEPIEEPVENEEPEADVVDVAVEVEDDLDGAAVVDYEPEPQNADPITDETVTVVDDTVQIVDADETDFAAEDDVTPEPPAAEIVPIEEEPAGEVAVVADDNAAERDDRATKISLRALQRELRQIDKA